MNQPRVPTIFAEHRRAARRLRAEHLAKRGDAAGWLAAEMASDAAERIAFMRLEPESALLVGAKAGAFSVPLSQVLPSINEDAPLVGGPFNLIVSLGQLDTVNDLPGALLHMRYALAPGGVMIASLLGAGSLPVLREIMLHADGERPAPRIHPQVDSRAATGLLERGGFARQVVDSARIRVSYRSFDRLIADLREQGLTSVLADKPPSLTRAAVDRAKAKFTELADEEGRVTETFEILTLTGWR